MQNATRPDVDKLISGGQARKRRRNLTWAVGAAVAVVLIAGGVYAATQLDGSDAGATGTATDAVRDIGTVRSRSPADPLGGRRRPRARHVPAPGGHRRHRRSDRGGPHLRGPGLGLGELPGRRDRRDPRRRSASTSPRRSRPGPAAAATRRTPTWARAREPSRGSSPGLPESKVVQPVTPTEAYGYDAFHLRLRIADDCPEGQGYRVAETPRGSRGISYSTCPETVVMDFWVLDIGTTSVVVDAWHQRGASADLVNQVAEVRDSITLVPAVVR